MATIPKEKIILAVKAVAQPKKRKPSDSSGSSDKRSRGQSVTAVVPPLQAGAVKIAKLAVSLTPFKKKAGEEGWRIKLMRDKTAGFIRFFERSNPIHGPGKYGFLDFKVNKNMQGKHIGRFALEKAIAQSEFKFFVAELRKSNIASKKALEAVGFVEFKHSSIKQCCMRYQKE